MMRTRKRQSGAALVESAITLSVFLLVVIGIIEFSMLMFTWVRGAEAARIASRQAAVSAPLVNVFALDCNGGGAAELSTTCEASAACDELYDAASDFLPQLTKAQLVVSYRCSKTGFAGRPAELFIPTITVKLVNVPYKMVLPGFLGLSNDWVLPDMISSRTGESLETIAAP